MAIVIEWDRTKLDAFTTTMERTEKQGNDVFEFEGHEFLVSYAKYLIEYLNTRV